jgi:hypothetical protein
MSDDRWADADALILNPNMPLSIFLPPPDLSHIHFVGSKDWNGLNAGVFFIRVHPWTVSMLTSAMSYPICHKDIELTFAEQEAMKLTFLRESGGSDDKGWQSGTVFMPRKWFDAYELFQGEIIGSDYYIKTIEHAVSTFPGAHMTHRYEGGRGGMIAHFAGVNDDVRQNLMDDWLDMLDDEWSLQYGNSTATVTAHNNSTRSKSAAHSMVLLNSTATVVADPVLFAAKTQMWENNVTANGTSLWTLPVHQTPLLAETTAFWNRYREALALSFRATASGGHDISVAKAALDLRIALADHMDEVKVVDAKIDKLKGLLNSVSS